MIIPSLDDQENTYVAFIVSTMFKCNKGTKSMLIHYRQRHDQPKAQDAYSIYKFEFADLIFRTQLCDCCLADRNISQLTVEEFGIEIDAIEMRYFDQYCIENPFRLLDTRSVKKANRQK